MRTRVLLSIRRIISGVGAAIVIAFAMAVPSVYGVSTWKYVLAAIGLGLFLLGGRIDSSTVSRDRRQS